MFQAQQGTLLQAQTMLLDEPNERLYVGAKNRLISLGLEWINTDHKEVESSALPAHMHVLAQSEDQ